MIGFMNKDAVLSDCQKYRYMLMRQWRDGDNFVLFVGLNPSTADATLDDPTITRCVRFAQRWGYDGLYMANVYAYRATDPKDMRKVHDPVGPLNHSWLTRLHGEASLTVACWGELVDGPTQLAMRKMLGSDLHVLRLNRGGNPGHPLYLPGDLTPVLWSDYVADEVGASLPWASRRPGSDFEV